MKVHLGCGKRNFGSDWVNIDIEKFPHVTSHSVETLPFADGSCDLLYASHLIEYFNREKIVEILNEWNRVLKPGGILRIAVPDFEVMCNLYKNGYSLDTFLGPLYGKWSNPAFYHKTVYDYRSLKELLMRIGFSKVHRYNWRHTEHAEHDDHSQAYIPHMDKEHGTLLSLNVEATK